MTTTDAYCSPPTFAEWAEAEIELRFWREALENLEAERRQATPEAIKAAHDFAIRAAAVDTAAIEGLYQVDRGFTFSVAAQTGAWEHYFDERGDKAREVFEDQLRAFELVLDAATDQLPLVEALIRSLHELVCASQDTYRVLTEQGWQEQELVRGEYKRHPNNPRLPDGRQHHYAPPLQVKEEMEWLTIELASPAFAAAPAPVQAAYAHFAFVTIHPFPDGNGRVARALSSIYLVRATSVPFVVFADQKPGYLDALVEADRGDWARFSEYIRDRSMDAMSVASLALQAARQELGDLFRGQLRNLDDSDERYSNRLLDVLAERILIELQGEIQASDRMLNFPKGVKLYCDLRYDEHLGPPPGFRKLSSSPIHLCAFVEIGSCPSSPGGVEILPLVNLDPQHPNIFRLEAFGKGANLDARFEEVAHGTTASLSIRMKSFANMIVDLVTREALDALARAPSTNK